jgi:signal transduction histidine kinase
MTPQTLERVFEPFYTEKRADRADGRAGTGLGLSITHAIIAAHGGRLRAESDGPGRGSRFVVELPGANQSPQAGAERL